MNALDNLDTSIALPAETWCLIFEFATFVPGIFCTADGPAVVAFTHDRYNHCSSRRVRQSMNLKLVIGRVCSNWRSLVTHLLFECISIKNGRQALQLAELLRDTYPKSNFLDANAKTWWTKRIELVIDGVVLWTTEHTNAIIEVLQHCPNLVCFSTAFSSSDPYLIYTPSLILALTKPGMKTKIKRLELKATTALFYAIAMELKSSLEVVWVLPSRRAPQKIALEKQELPKLHTFISGIQDGPCFDLPALQILVSCDTIERTSHIVRSGGTLQYLNMIDFGSSIPYLTLCPNLRTLLLGVHEITRLRSNNFLELSHLHIHTLIIECTNMFRLSLTGAGSDFVHRYLPALLSGFFLNVNFPALKRIRFIFSEPDPITRLEPPPLTMLSSWRKWFEECHLQGISIEVSYDIEQLTSDLWVPLTLDLVQEHL
ncbi:hypothetical protein BDZ94DRAFT_377044 [Collybia nuda]|uniref:F-box domain-containing protein n=1 Tax=Collybia nuda TaxID=64659 RepID=A0A9P5YG81_9AGAR|nr:hypothetical protein BDZ94DRAFT_377044 [Collybia nuda]